jgi:hypothetical protein
MKVPLSLLEEARRNPASARSKLVSGARPPIKYTPNQLLQHVILRFHKQQMTVAEAHKELLQCYHAKFTSKSDLDEVLEDFDEYIADYQRLDNDAAVIRHRLKVRLPDYLAGGIEVTGQIPRLDASSDGGYAARLFAKRPRDWRGELRLPIIQATVATDLGVDIDEVTVGLYCFDDGDHQATSFANEEIAAAYEELGRVLAQLL